MITMLTPSAELFQAMASSSSSSSAKAAAAEGKFLKNAQQGFMSCVTKVYNSLTTMKDVVVEGFHRLTVRMKTPAAKDPTSTPNVASLDPISIADTRKFCQEIKQKMAANPDSINGMFRQSPTKNYGEFNQLLNNQADLIAAIKNDKIDNIVAGSWIKEWMSQSLAGNKFSAEECKRLVANKHNRTEVNRIVAEKFNSSDINELEKKDKFISLLSVMRTYRDVSASNLDKQNRQHDPNVVKIVTLPILFNFDNNLMNLFGTANRASFDPVINDWQEAFTALMDHCSPGVPPKPVMTRFH